VELNRQDIERTDFGHARRGYDSSEVDRHLREVADAVEELKRRGPAGPTTTAATAADQVRGILEAAEASAAEIQQKAEAEARRITEEASANTRQSREQADAEAARRLQRAEEAAERIIERAATVEAEVERLLGELRNATKSVVQTLDSGAGALQAELTELRSEYGSVRGPDGDGPPDAEPEVVAEVRETAPETPDAGADGDLPEELEEPGEGELELEAEPEPEPELEQEAEKESAGGRTIRGAEGARLIALNMALNGTPREETERYLEENFDLDDQEALLDEVYARVGS
jgi:DivIVA domain-containing protein